MGRKAFTLIELLVVIGILSGLIGVILPTMRYCKEKARSVTCLSNIRQLTGFIATYSQTNRTYPYGFCDLPGYFRYPVSGDFLGDQTQDWAGWWWSDFIVSTKEESDSIVKMLACPSSVSTNLLCENYGINYSICKFSNMQPIQDEFFGTPLASSQIHSPSRVILLADSGYSMVSWKATLAGSAYAYENPKRNDWYYIPGIQSNQSKSHLVSSLKRDSYLSRHLGRTINVGFCDGHVEKMVSDAVQAAAPVTGSTNTRIPYWSP